VAQKKLRIAVIGTGFGRYHMEGYHKNPDAELVAICDLNEPEAKEFADKYGAERVTTDYRKIAEMDDIDIVSVATPNNLHKEMTVAMLESGKHVLCEKPMAHELADAVEMVQVADRCGKRLMIQMTLRFLTHYRDMVEVARSGVLGEVYAGRGSMVRRKTIPSLDFRPEEGFARGEWFIRKADAGGGAIVDIGVHTFDLMWWAMGNPKPVAVSGILNTSVAHPRLAARGLPAEIDDMAACWVRFENGAHGFCEVTWDAHMEESSCWRVFGAEGGVQLNTAGTDAFKSKAVRFGRVDGRSFDAIIHPDPMHRESAMDHMVACVLDPEKEMIASGKELLTVMYVLDAIRRSAADGGKEILL
jgi:predicted dehydrogenase